MSEIRDKCREMRARPMAITKIAAELGVTRQCVSLYTRDMGVKKQLRGPKELSDSDVLAVLTAGAVPGITLVEIVSQTGVKAHVARQILQGKRCADRYPEIARGSGYARRRRVKPADGTVGARVVEFLSKQSGAVRFPELLAAMGVSTGSLSGTLFSCERRGLVRRESRGVWAAVVS